MKKTIFNGYHMLVIIVLTAGITMAAMANLRQAEPEGKYAFLDKEAAVAEIVFANPAFNDDDRKSVVEAINAVQKRYTDQGYAVLTKESCKADAGAIVLAAVPGKPLDITQELVSAFHSANGEKQ